MAHLLYRPHIDHGDKIVATDFLIREIGLSLPGLAPEELPVDLASCAVELAARGGSTLVSAGLFLFIGDNQPFAAPMFALLDGRLHGQDPMLAWQNARLSVARHSIVTEGQPRIECRFGDEDPLFLSAERLIGAGRHRGAVIPVGKVREVAVLTNVGLTISASARAGHRLTLTALRTGAQG